MAAIEKNKDLRNLHTFGLPWIAKKYIKIISIEDLEQFFAYKKKYPKTKVLVLGGGSNLLPTKKFDGLVVHNQLAGVSLEEKSKTVEVSVMAGEDWHKFTRRMVKRGFSGIENLSLIPGSVGGAVVQNIGAYDQVIADSVKWVRAISLNTGKEKMFKQNECKFEYRNSLFKNNTTWMVIEICLALNTKFNPVLTYKDLDVLRGKKEITIREVSDFIIGLRRKKLPNWHMVGTAGSFFRNPRVGQKKVNNIKKKFPDVPLFHNYGSKKTTIPAGWLVQQAGISPEDKAEYLYPKHSLVVINKYKGLGVPPARHGQQIKRATERIAKAVEDDFGIKLDPEVIIL